MKRASERKVTRAQMETNLTMYSLEKEEGKVPAW